MRKHTRPSLEVAAAVAASAKKVGMYVVSSPDDAILKAENASAVIARQSFAKHQCAKCSTTFNALAVLASPFCPTCGDGKVKKVTEAGKEGKIQIHSDEHLVNITCASCGTHQITHEAIASALGKDMHCSACGASMVKAAEDDEGLEDDAGDTDDLENSLEELGEDVSIDEGDDLPAAEDMDVQDVDDESDETAEFPELDDDSAGDDAGNAGSEVVEDPEGEAEANAEGDLDEDLESVDDELPVESSDGDEESLDVDMQDMVDPDEVQASVVVFGDRMVLATPHYIVAGMSKEEAGDNQDVFGTDGFAQAIAGHLTKHGISKTIAAFGFKPERLKAKNKKALDRRVQAAVAAETASLKKSQLQLTASFQQCLDLATVGLNKNYWAGKQHPLHAALVRELETAGFRNPSKLVDRVFDKHGVEYAHVLVETANTLLQKSVEARNELADSLDMTTRRVVAGDNEFEDEDGVEDEGGDETLASIIPLSKQNAARVRQQIESAGTGDSVVSALVASAGDGRGRLFNF
jgi:predicted RNA-binding Zn-ribbon protein involved in translation (DUF1610 family)